MLTPLLRLKIAILSGGITIDDDAAAALTFDHDLPFSSQDYATTRGIPLHLGGDVYVNAPYLERFVEKNAYVLSFIGCQFHLQLPEGAATMPVRVFPIPAYYSKRNKQGRLYSHIVNTHTDRARINPIVGCSMRCDFCDAPSHRYERLAVSEMVDAIGVAVNDRIKPARHVLISGGTPTLRDEAYMDEVYKVLTKVSPVPVDVMLSPRKSLDYPARLAEWGVNDIFVNIEGTNNEINSRYLPHKHKLGLKHYLAFIQKTVKAFGPRRVMSLIIVGLEPLDNTLYGVRALAELGCIPVLSPFRPAIDTPLESRPAPTENFLSEALEACTLAAHEYGVSLGPKCSPCNHNTLTPELSIPSPGGSPHNKLDLSN